MHFYVLFLPLFLCVLKVEALHLNKRRFGQENPPVLNELRGLEQLAGLNSGRFFALAGQFPGSLLAARNPCDRYKIIEEAVALCKANNCGPQAIIVGTKLAAAEKNFNPANGKGKPSFCNDTTIPSIPELRCIVPMIDPDFAGASEFNAKVNARLAQIQASQNPELCAGQSVQQQALALGVNGCVGCDAGGNKSLSAPVTKTPEVNTTPPETVNPDPPVAQVSTPPVVNSSAPAYLVVKGPNPPVSNVNSSATNPVSRSAKPPQTSGPASPTSSGNNAAVFPAPANPGPSNGNLNKFTGTLGGIPSLPVTFVNGLFQITEPSGNVQRRRAFEQAISMACEIQKNNCTQFANAPENRGGPISPANCANQSVACIAASVA